MAKRPSSDRKSPDQPASSPSSRTRKGASKGVKPQEPDLAEKVGSSEQAAEQFGGPDDFGIPAKQAQPQQQSVVDGTIDDRPLGSRMPSADPDGVRTVGVGAPDGDPGSGSGGDLDPDIIGVGTGSGIAANPASGRTEGPDIIESVDEDKVFGPPSKGDHELPAGTHGVSEVNLQGTVHDRMDRETGTASVEDDDVTSGVDRSTGEDADDREAATGAD